MSAPTAELIRRFAHHPPKNKLVENLHTEIRDACFQLADKLNSVMPDGRESAQALSALELVMFHANAAVARNQ